MTHVTNANSQSAGAANGAPASALNQAPTLRATTETILDERAARLAQRKRDVEVRRDGGRMLVFTVCRERFGLDVQAIAEILSAQSVIHVCASPLGVLGVLNVRGELTTVLSLASLLGLREGEEPDSGYVLVLRVPNERIALRVDSVLRAQALPAQAELSTADDVVGAAAASLVQGVTRDGAALLDARALMQRCLGSSMAPTAAPAREMEANNKVKMS